jgi:hypothetical protein
MSVSRLTPMSRMAAPILALALGAAVAVALVSCGNRDTKGLLPGDTADQIVTNLERVQQDASEGSCTSAAQEVATIQDQINSLPSSVDSRLRARLQAGAQRLADVINSPGACETTTPESTSTTTSTESTTTKEKTKSTTVPTTTSTSTSTTTSTTLPSTTTVPGPPTGGTPGGVVPPGRENAGPGGGEGDH